MSEDLCICAIVLRQTESTTMMSGRIARPLLSLSLLSHAQAALESLI